MEQQNFKHIMIDIETLSIDTNALPLTIAAVIFDPYDKEKDQIEFYYRVDLKEIDVSKFKIDLNTIVWWMYQSKKARDEAFISKPRTSLYQILIFLSEFITKNDVKYIWSHGKDFDCVLLKNMYNIYNLKCPWMYYDTRDTRTLFHLANINYNDIKLENLMRDPKGENFIEEDIKHNALLDCKRQIYAVQLAYKVLMD